MLFNHSIFLTTPPPLPHKKKKLEKENKIILYL